MTPIVILMTVGVVVSGWNNKRKSRGEESERAARLLFPRPPLILGMAMQIIQKWSKCPNLWENCEKLWSWSILSIVLSQNGISPPIGGLQPNYKLKWFCWSSFFPFSKSIPLVSILWNWGSSIKNFKACVFVCVCLFVSKHVSVGGTAAPHMSNNLSFSLFPSNPRQPPPHSCAGRRKSKASSLVFNKESTGEKTNNKEI